MTLAAVDRMVHHATIFEMAQMIGDRLRVMTASPIYTVNQQGRRRQLRHLNVGQLTHETAALKCWRLALHAD